VLTLITGQPGNGKTLHALWLVEALRKRSGRAVYQHGLKELMLDWQLLDDPKKWAELPEGSIIVLDEAWEFFPIRKQGSQLPVYVEALATHRHRGFDVFLITQDRKQLDTFVRTLVGRHINVVRRFGRESAVLYQWEKCSDPSSTIAYKEALKVSWPFPKEVYGWYKSAEVHTVEKDFPVRKLLFVGVGLAVVVFCIILVVRHIGRLKDSRPESSHVLSSVAVVVPPVVSPWDSSQRVVRVEGVPESAPMYDALYKVLSTPKVAGCSRYDYGDGVVECTCTTDQSTVVDMPVAQCVAWMKKGAFDPTRRPINIKQENISYLNSVRGTQPSAVPMSNESKAAF